MSKRGDVLEDLLSKLDLVTDACSGAACKSQECKLGGSDCHRLAKEHASDLASGSSTLSNCIVPKVDSRQRNISFC